MGAVRIIVIMECIMYALMTYLGHVYSFLASCHCAIIAYDHKCTSHCDSYMIHGDPDCI